MSAVAALATLILVAACSGVSQTADEPGASELLRNHLSVASAALAAGQPAVARRVYASLAVRFDDAPEPALGLGYVALYNNELDAARRQFLRAADLAQDSPAMRGEALLGAGRAALALGDTRAARQHLLDARTSLRDGSSVMWIENGLAVAAVLEGDYETAQSHYTEALRRPSAHPRIAANFVRMLIASGQNDAAVSIYDQYDASFWEEDDTRALRNLVHGARRQPETPRRVDGRLLLKLPPLVPAVSIADEWPSPSAGVALAGARGLTLRLTGEAGWDVPPAVHAVVPGPTNSGASQDRPESGAGEGSTRNRPSPNVSFASEHRVPKPRSAHSASITGPAATGPNLAGPPDASLSPLLLLAADDATPPDTTASALAPETQSVAAPVPIPSSRATAPGQSNGIWEADSVQLDGATLVADDFHLGSLSDASFIHPDLSPDPTGLPGQASASPSAAKADAASHSTRLHALRNGFLNEKATPSKRLTLGTAEFGHAFPSHASFVQSVFLFDLTALPSGTTAKAIELARGAHVAPFADGFGSGAEPWWHRHVRQSEGAWSATMTLAAANLDLGARPRGAFPESTSSADHTLRTPSANVSAAHPTSEVRSALLTTASLSELEPGPVNGERESKAARHESAALVVSATEPAQSSDTLSAETSASFASAPSGPGPIEELIQHAWTDRAAPAAASPPLLLASADGKPDLIVQPSEHPLGSVISPDGWIVLLGKSRRWHLDNPAKAVAAASPEIADVQLLSPTVLYVIGKRAGSTSISVLSENGSVLKRDVFVVIDVEPLRALLGRDPGLQGVQVQRLARGVALGGEVGSPAAAERAVGLAVASIPEDMLVENNLEVGLDLGPLRSLMAGEAGLDGVQVQRVARGVALSGEVSSVATSERAARLAAASLPEGMLVENNLRVALDVEPLRALLGADPDLQSVQVQRLARGVALGGEVGSLAAAERAVGLAVASIPEDMLVENNLEVGLDLGPLRSLMAGEAGLDGVQVQRVARGVALSGEVASVATSERAARLAAASLPEGMLVENNLRVALDVEPLRALLGADPDLQGVQVQRLARGVALGGRVGSLAAAERAVGLAVASIPEDMLVENNLEVGLDLGPLRSLMAGEAGLDGVQVQRVARGVALSGEVASVATSERAARLAAASLPEGMLVENNLRVTLDVGPLRALLGADPDLKGVQVQRLARGVALSGEVRSPAAAERAVGLAAASILEGMPVENNLRVALDVAPLSALLAAHPDLQGVQVHRLARGVALSGEVGSPAAAERAVGLAIASLPEGMLVENSLRVALDVAPLRALLAADPDLRGVRAQAVARGVALIGEVTSPEAADRAVGLAAASLPEGMLVENNLEVGLDLELLRSLLAHEPALAGIQVQRVARGVALSGDVSSEAEADRAVRLAAASLPEDVSVENNLRLTPNVDRLGALLAGDPGLRDVHIQRLERGVVLSGEVDSPGAAERAVQLAVASLPEGMLVQSNLEVGLDLGPLRSLMAGEAGLDGVQVQRVARGVALSGKVASVATSERAARLATASLPEGVLVENNLRVALDVEPLRALLGRDPELWDVRVQRLARGVALTGAVGSAAAAERAVGLAVASIPEDMLVENNLEVGLDLGPLRSLMAGEAGLDGVQVQRVARGVALSGKVASVATSERAARLATASLPEGVLVENNLRVALDVEPLRALLGRDPELWDVRVQRLARGVALTGAVGSAAAAERAVGLAVASIPEDMLVENNLEVGLDLDLLRELLGSDPDLRAVQVRRVARGVVVSGEVGSEAAAERAVRLAAASLPEGTLVENSLRVALDVRPLRALLAADPDLRGVLARRVSRGVALSGEVGSEAAAERAVGLAAASIPADMLVENNLEVRLDLAPLRALMAEEPELNGVRVQRVSRGVALSGEVGSPAEAERAMRLAAASLPEGMLVENNLRPTPNVDKLRVVLARNLEFRDVRVQRLERGVALTGNVGSPTVAERAMRLAVASLPEGMLVENNLEVGLDLGPLRSLMASEPGLDGIQVRRVARGVALSGEVSSEVVAERAVRLAVVSLPEEMLVESNLRIATEIEPLRRLLANEPDLRRVRVQRVARGVALSGEVGSAAASERVLRFAVASLPKDALVDNHMRIAGPQQVNLEVQIAEVQRSIAEDFGFNWEIFGHSNDPLGFGFRIGRGLPDGTSLAAPERLTSQPHPSLPPNLGANNDGNILLSIPITTVDGLLSPTFMFQRAWDNVGLNGFVDALAKAGLANVLARPNVTASSGETASFFSGGEYPLPTGFEDGVIVFEYKKYGVLLDFVPTIIDEERIELTVRPEVSEPSQDNSVQVVSGVNVPVINVRRAETTVEMGDGESIVIAGLFRSASNEVESGVPLLKDLPLVGALFGHSSTRADELELIVTVTARLVDAGPVPDGAGLAASGRVNKYYY